MAYIVKTSVQQFFNERGHQVSPDGVHAVEVKLVEFLEKICDKCRGHKWRINATIVNVVKMGN